MEATTYKVDFENNTSDVWTIGVYQELPDSVGLDSVSWKQGTAPPSGGVGVKWDLTYNVLLADFYQQGSVGVYTSSQSLETLLGKSWNIVYEDGVQQLKFAGDLLTKDQIKIANNSGFMANPGIGMSGSGSVYKRSVLSGSYAQFEVTPTYWFGLFSQLVPGEVIQSNVVVGPFELQFPSGMTRATITASIDGSTIVVTITYSQMFVVELSQVKAHLRSLQELRGRALTA